MSLSDLASIATVVSSIAVLGSLVYLGYQTRQNARHTRDLTGSFCTKQIDRNWLGKELCHAEEETQPGADSDAAAAD